MITKSIKTAAIVVACAAALAQGAGVGVPMQNMSTYSLAAEYYTNVSGHEALYKNADTSEAIWGHYMRLHYAPLPYLRLTAGVGGSRFYADPRIRGASAGTSPTFGVGVYSPRIADFLTITAGYNWTYVSAKHSRRVPVDTITGRWLQDTTWSTDADDNPTFEVGERTYDTTGIAIGWRGGDLTGSISTMNFGAILSAGRYVDFEVGVQLHSYSVSRRTTMSGRRETFEDGFLTGRDDWDSTTVVVKDSVADQTRLYAAVTLHERASGAYLNFGTAYNLDRIEGRGAALSNFSVWGSIGLIMRESQKVRTVRDRRDNEEYLRLRQRQDKMMDVLIDGIDYDGEEEEEGD